MAREEVWLDLRGEVAKYNLAYINQYVFADDHGRVLGYDNAHGYHGRHEPGTARAVEFTSCGAWLQRFREEVQHWRVNT